MSTTTPTQEHEANVFRVHTIVFAYGMALIVLTNLLTNVAVDMADKAAAWWSLWAFVGWSLALAAHRVALAISTSRSAA